MGGPAASRKASQFCSFDVDLSARCLKQVPAMVEQKPEPKKVKLFDTVLREYTQAGDGARPKLVYYPMLPYHDDAQRAAGHQGRGLPRRAEWLERRRAPGS